MEVKQTVTNRANYKCELCSGNLNTELYLVKPRTELKAENQVLLCTVCSSQVDNPATADGNHWRCLNDSMWSEVEAVKVLAWRMLTNLKAESWPVDLLDMMYLEEESLAWAKADLPEEVDEAIVHKDSNGIILSSGDSVVLIKDLNVKGANFTAKRGTAVRNISLVYDNEEQIEGRVDGQQIVILTQFVKKSN